jgi:phosphopantothenoylcysteine decarboxylase / phosphopantothenate---cysteine ligase
MTHVILGISGSISAYKTPELTRQLKKSGYEVSVVLTHSAQEFVSARTLSIVSETKALTNDWADITKTPHIEYTRKGDILVIAPATANSIAKFAHGLADDALSCLFITFQGPIIIAPAMHTEMWENAATKANIATLKNRGIHIIGPEYGDLACGDSGKGRLIGLPFIVDAVKQVQEDSVNITNKNILITSGGTSEDIDQVRVLTNKSSGKLGQQLAKSAHFNGANVTLITTTPVDNPGYTKVIISKSVDAMKIALENEVPHCDILYMAAAVSDFKAKDTGQTKIRRTEDLSLECEGTPDLLKHIAPLKGVKTYIGFCLATDDLENIAKEKRIKKGVDYIVANTPDVFGTDIRSVTIYSKDKKEAILNASLHKISVHLLKLAE